MYNFAGRIMIGFKVIEGHLQPVHRSPLRRGERRLCHADINRVSVYVCTNYCVVLPLTVEKVSTDQQDCCTTRAHFFFFNLYRPLLESGCKQNIQLKCQLHAQDFFSLQKWVHNASKNSDTCSFVLHWEVMKPVCLPVHRCPVVSGSDLGSSLQARFSKKRLVFQTKAVYQSLHTQRIEYFISKHLKLEQFCIFSNIYQK